MKKPNVKDFDLKPYGYIDALQDYIDFLEAKKPKEKIIKNLKIKDFYFQPYGCIHYIDLEDKENIYLNRLKEQYKEIFKFENWSEYKRERQNDYQAMRLFCLETQLITLDDIELMENEISSSF